MKPKFKTLYLLGLLLLFACVERVDPIKIDETNLVIFGNLYNPSSYLSISIFETSSTTKYKPNRIRDANIRLYTASGNSPKTLVTDQFRFNSDPEFEDFESVEKIETIVGNKYWIEIDIPGRSGVYESTQIEMIPPVKIKKVTRANGATRITFQDPKDEPNQYLAIFTHLNDLNPQGNIPPIEIDENYLTSADRLFDGNANAYMEVFNTPGNLVRVELYNLAPEIYQFYLKYANQIDQNEGFNDEEGDPGFLFRQPPTQLTGNIFNETSDELVLGNFGVIATDEMSQTFSQ